MRRIHMRRIHMQRGTGGEPLVRGGAAELRHQLSVFVHQQGRLRTLLEQVGGTTRGDCRMLEIQASFLVKTSTSLCSEVKELIELQPPIAVQPPAAAQPPTPAHTPANAWAHAWAHA